MEAAGGRYALWTVGDLRKELTRRGLPPTGSKQDMADRLSGVGGGNGNGKVGAHHGSPLRSGVDGGAARNNSMGSPGGLGASPSRRSLTTFQPLLSLHPTIDTGVAKRVGGGALHPEADALPAGGGLPVRRVEAPTAVPGQRQSSLRPRPFGHSASQFNRPKRRFGVPQSASSGQHASREPPQKRRTIQGGGVQTIDLEQSDIGGRATAAMEESSPRRPPRPLRRQPTGSEQLPPPPAGLGLRARQLRMLLGGGACVDLQQTYSDLLESFNGEAAKVLPEGAVEVDHGQEGGTSSDSRKRSHDAELDGVEEVARDDVAAAAAVRRARKAVAQSVRGSSTADAWLLRLKRKENLVSESIANNDEAVATTALELEAATSWSRQLRFQYEVESQSLQNMYEAEILALQQQLSLDEAAQSAAAAAVNVASSSST